jgi:AraC-like DNA-binding protein
MEWTKGECSKLISFVSACAEDRDKNQTKTKKPKGNLKGSEARNFYENLVSDEKVTPSKDETIQNSTKKTCPISTEENNDRVGNSVNQDSCQSDISELDINRYLRYAQEGNIQQVKNMLKKGASVDSQDRYGWTALMCAAHNGQFVVVKHLLSIGADVSVVDENNKNVSDIARTAGFKKISLFIQKWKKEYFKMIFKIKKWTVKVKNFIVKFASVILRM